MQTSQNETAPTPIEGYVSSIYEANQKLLEALSTWRNTINTLAQTQIEMHQTENVSHVYGKTEKAWNQNLRLAKTLNKTKREIQGNKTRTTLKGLE